MFYRNSYYQIKRSDHLLAKERGKPIKIDQLEALLRGLNKNHSKIPLIEPDLKKRKAGYNGEKAVDYQLSFLKDKKYMVFNDSECKCKLVINIFFYASSMEEIARYSCRR